MSVFARIAGTEEPKIRTLFLLNDFKRLFDGTATDAQVQANHDIKTNLEKAELAEYKAAITGKITALYGLLKLLYQVDTRNDLTTPQKAAADALCLKNARGMVFLELFVSSLQIEQGAVTLAEFRTSLGLTP